MGSMDHIKVFNDYRRLLFSVAYRMLGSVMDAEDMVQEAFLRWQAADHDDVHNPKGFLTTIVTRLCLDYLKSARIQRETYIGPWLPEPVITANQIDARDHVEGVESLTMAFLVLLERLTPTERAVILLRDVFEYGYDEIAAIVEKSEANCRQMAKRARDHIEAERPRFDPSPGAEMVLVDQFVETVLTGDMDGLVSLLAEDVALYSDGGGKAVAARKPIFGAFEVARFLGNLPKLAPPDTTTSMLRANGEPAIVIRSGDQIVSVIVLQIEEGHITRLHNILNPDKLTRLVEWSGS